MPTTETTTETAETAPNAPLSESYWPATTDGPLREVTLGLLLDEGAAAHPDRAALVYDEPGREPRTWTYRELVAESQAVARALLARYTPGEHVAVWAPNCSEWVLLQHGAARAGITLVTVNPAYKEDELRHVLEQSSSVAVFHADSSRGTDMAAVVAAVAAELPELRAVHPLSDWDAFASSGDPDLELPAVDPGSAAQIQYTSGTTGKPKGVLLHHAGIVNSASFVAERAAMPEGVVSVNSMPLFHIGGCGVMEMGTYSKGGTYVLAPGFDPAHVLELIERHGGHITLAVPTMLLGLIDHPDRQTRDLSSLTTIMTGGASVPAELVRAVKRAFECLFTISYGQTETCGVMTQTSVYDTEVDQAETIGRALPHAEVKIISPDDGQVVPPGVQGEICMRGYQIMLGYWDNPEASGHAVDDEGWLHSGDLGVMDERGYIRITGRSKDMIVRGGEKIFPREIENVLFDHPAVSDVAVIGVPDEKWGERVVAVLVLADAAPDTGELRSHCEERLARFKVPVEWKVVTAFPQTPSGKVQKFALRDGVVEGSIADLGG